MEPSTWNDTNQHWLPRFILKGFGQKGNASQVFELDCRTGEIMPRTVDEVASTVHLLSEKDDQFLRRIEDLASKAVGKIRRGQDIDEEDRINLDELVWALMINDPHHGVDREKTRGEVIAETIQEVVEVFHQEGGKVNPDGIAGMVEQNLNYDYLYHAMSPPDAAPREILRRMGLSVYQPPYGESFVIGDSPVLAVRGSRFGTTSLMNPGSQLIFPIQHSRLLVYDWTYRRNLVRYGGCVSLEQVRTLDEDYRYRLNCGYLYGRTRESLLRSSKLSLQWSAQNRSEVVCDGWYAARVAQRELDESRARLNVQQQSTLRVIARQIVNEAAQQRLNSDK